MTFMDHATAARIHREACAAALKGLLPWGREREFALRKVNITPNYLSNLLNPDHDPPSPAVAARLVDHLPLDREDKLRLLEHFFLAWDAGRRLVQTVHADWSGRPLASFLEELRAGYHHSAAVASDPVTVQRAYRTVYDAGFAILRRINPHTHPLAFIETCMLIHTAAAALNRRVDALFLAQRARDVMFSLPPGGYDQNRELFDNLRANVPYAEVAALRALNRHRLAYDLANAATETIRVELQHKRIVWTPYFLKDQIQALSRMPRFERSEVEGLRKQALALFERNIALPPPHELTFPLQIDRAAADAMMRYGSPLSIRRAEELLRPQYERLSTLTDLGPLHHVMLLRSYARLQEIRGNLEERDLVLRTALSLASAAGLTHQLSQIHAEFGETAAALLNQPPSTEA